MHPSRWPIVEQLRTLVSTFFGRFFETEITTGGQDRLASLFFVIAFLAMPGFIAPFFIGMAGVPWNPPDTWGWDLIARKLGVDALRQQAFTDKGSYLAASMAAAGIIGALTWNSLLTDRRDALILGSLPVHPSRIVFARLVALALFFVIVSLGMHALAAVSFGTFLAAENTWGFFLRGIGAHFVASVGASMFVLLTLTGVQGAALALVGPRGFARVSPVLQVALVGTVIASLALLPQFNEVLRAAVRAGGPASLPANAWLLPPMWFLGMYETVLGTPDELLHRLARVGTTALACVAAATIVGYAIAYRRLMSSALETRATTGRGSWLSRSLVATIARDDQLRGVVQFVVFSIARLERHRLVLAGAIGGGLAWGLPGWIALGRDTATEPTAAVVAIVYALLVFVLAGLRLAIALPADLKAAWVFEFSLAEWRTVRTAVERVLLVFGVAPIVLVSSLAAWRLWGWPTALTHLGVSGAFGWLLVEGALWRFTGMPCAEPWQSNGARIRAMWPVYLLLFVASTAGMAGLEWAVLARPHFAIVITTYLAAVALALRHMAIRRSIGGRVFRPGDSGQPDADSRDASNDGSLFRAYRSGGRVSAALARIRELRTVELTSRDSLRRLGHDVRIGFRRLLHRPLYSCFAIGTIAIGVGATTGLYAIAYAVLLKPADIPQIDRVVNVDQQGLGPFRQRTLSWADYQDLRVMQTSFRELVAFSPFSEVMMLDGATRIVFGEAVDDDYFTLVGARIALGRPLVPSDNEPTAPAVIVLGDKLWRTTFAADPAVVGRTIKVGDELFQVVGVARADLRGLVMPNIRPTEAWVPIASATRLRSMSASVSRDDHWLRVKGRLSDGRTPDEARTELGTIARQLDASHPIHPTDKRYIRRWTSFPAADVRLFEPMSDYSVPLALIVMTAVGLVLLIACTNLANLNLARAMTRRHEMAVRLAVGASRFRLIQEQVVESALVACAGGIAATAIAVSAIRYFGSDFTLRLQAGFNVDVTPTITPGVVVIMVGSIVLAVLVSGVWPAWRLTRTNARAALSAASSTVSSSGWRGRQSLVAAQVGGSVVLLAAAVLFTGGMVARLTRDPGFRTDGLAVAQLELTGATPWAADNDVLQQWLTDRIRRQSGTSRVAFASSLPTGMSSGSSAIDLGVPLTPPVFAGHIEATPNFLDVMGIRLESGRLFSSTGGDSREVVVSQLAARQLFGHANVIGQQIFVNRRANAVAGALTIVGIASDTDVGSIGQRSRGMVYQPFGATRGRRLLLLARTADTSDALLTRIRSVTREVDADIALVEVTTGDVATGVSIALERFVAGLSGLLGVTALLLAMTGLFGVLSARVLDRTREIGIHAALGATRRRVTRMVLFDGMRPVLEGLTAGAIVALTLRFSAQAIFPRLGVPPWNWMLLAVPLLLLFGAAAACYLPTRRAMSIEPARTLRNS